MTITQRFLFPFPIKDWSWSVSGKFLSIQFEFGKKKKKGILGEFNYPKGMELSDGMIIFRQSSLQDSYGRSVRPREASRSYLPRALKIIPAAFNRNGKIGASVCRLGQRV